ncbi:hypothetical protein DFR55_101369 [Herbinix hemicellulosilytica]|uniref:STAS domain-containing protein n=1 Tax=Herbinix hemicellulosilytica TaxID=1564487 RepID=A0A0H5SWA1_HERHM|nr:hypothetical protein [Herbinix hemicellulosilytica]RBP60908.1 hypothetical protein DFR55_101369 [Herbinix hemicellulosilytica]CRZ34603.1 hypothetical protein HHT355_1402 [Herbinix hemicellulosilytica]
MVTINFPQVIKTCNEGYGYTLLAECIKPLLEAPPGEIVFLDFSNLFWLDANLLPIIGACFEHRKSDLIIKFREKQIRDSIKRIWGKNGFGKYFGIDYVDDEYNSVIAYKVFKGTDGKKFGKYIDEVLLTKSGLADMSDVLKKKISTNIQEIFGNAPMHGQCDKVISCGQIYFSTNQLIFTIVNLGKTIKRNVIDFFSTYLKKEPPKHGIEWAVIEDHSTKPLINGKCGGKGLAFLNEFITKNKGEIHICSGNEYWQTGKKGERASNIYSYFPGTIVTIVINLDDQYPYATTDENEDDDIFNIF